MLRLRNQIWISSLTIFINMLDNVIGDIFDFIVRIVFLLFTVLILTASVFQINRLHSIFKFFLINVTLVPHYVLHEKTS